MTAVGTGLVGGPSSAATLVDLASARSGGSNVGTDGGFEALFSRTLEADDLSSTPNAVRDERGRRPDAEDSVGRVDRTAGDDRRRNVTNDDARVRRSDHPGRDRSGPDDAASAAQGSDTTVVDEPDEADESRRTDAAVASMVAVVPATPGVVAPGGAIAVTPTVGTGMALDGAAVELISDTAVAQDGAAPGLQAVPQALDQPIAAAGPGEPTPEAFTQLVAGASDAMNRLEQSAVAATELVPTAPSAAADTTDSPVPVLPGSAGAGTGGVVGTPTAQGSPTEPAAAPAPAAVDHAVPTTAAPSTEAVEAAAAAAMEPVAVRSGADEPVVSAAAPQRSSASTDAAVSAAAHAGRPTTDAATASAAPTGPAVPAGADQLADLRRMRERAALGGARGGSMSVDLSDEGLGPLTLHAQQSAGGLHLTLNAADPATRDLLSRQEAALRSDLEASGATLGSLDIQQAGARSSGGRGSGAGEQATPRSPLISSSATSPAASTVGALARSSRTASSDGVDLLI